MLEAAPLAPPSTPSRRRERQIIAADVIALLLTGLIGVVTFRRLVNPIQALERSVKTIAAGDYTESVPFTGASDETGSLARSIEVLKQGAAAIDEQRWVKSSASGVVGELQGAGSLEEFGHRLLSGRAPARRRRCRVLRLRREIASALAHRCVRSRS